MRPLSPSRSICAESPDMARRLPVLLLLALVLLMPTVPVKGETAYIWAEGEITYPEGEDWVYRFTYRYPILQEDSPAALSVNAWFGMAFSEMNDLILPMFASETDMAGTGRNEMAQMYDVTCNTDDFFGVLLTQTQGMGDEVITMLSGQVFAMSGAYTGESLTLRGLLGVGDSSEQIARAVVADVWQTVQVLPDALERWPDPDTFLDDFDPETQFYADQDSNAVFFLQPGILEPEIEPITFVYSPLEAEALLLGNDDEKEIAP